MLSAGAFLDFFSASSIAACSIEANLSIDALVILSASSIADTCSIDARLSRFTLSIMLSAGAFLDFFSRQKISLTSCFCKDNVIHAENLQNDNVFNHIAMWVNYICLII